MSRVGIVIIGAGPTGLGAAWRLEELGARDWLLLERSPEPGGLAGSVLDEAGYTWDRGGHIQFSHYEYFDELMDELLAPDEWLHHDRESWVWISDRFVPYPFQHNLRYLPREVMWDCVLGLIRLRAEAGGRPPENFGQWIQRTFGEGICRHFMEPYNRKVWAYPLDELAYDWIGDRVAVTDLERVVKNIILERDDVGWGPNNRFRFPLRGGTGEVWRRCAARLPEGRLRLGAEVLAIDTRRREVHVLGSAEPIRFERLISTMPLDRLIQLTDLGSEPGCQDHAGRLRHSSTHVIGMGVRGRPRSEVATKCWMYFPEPTAPFYRATVFSNYSPFNVPDIERGWSLMCEVSESPAKPVEATTIVEEAIRGAVATRLIRRADDVIHVYHARLPYGYPTPSLGRDAALGYLLPRLAERGLYSRGRFGAWKYEVSNQDHSLMQGVECVDYLLEGKEETTVWRPDVVNLRRGRLAPAKR